MRCAFVKVSEKERKCLKSAGNVVFVSGVDESDHAAKGAGLILNSSTQNHVKRCPRE